MILEMKNVFTRRMLMLLTLLLGAVSAISASDSFYIEAINIEPGETRQLNLILDNSQDFFGFQADITLPDGLELVQTNDNVNFSLSSRADRSFTKVSKILSDNSVRIGAFSLSHKPFEDNTGVLAYLGVRASDGFEGGIITMNNILFVDSKDMDVEFPDCSLEIGTTHFDRCFAPDFDIAVGETKSIAIELDNETPFTAFQIDLYPPKGLKISDRSISLASARISDHILSTKAFPDGRIRIICLSLSNALLSGNKGTLLYVEVTAARNIGESSVLEIKNQIFTMADAMEYVLPDTETIVTAVGEFEEIFPTSVVLSENHLVLMKGDSFQITAEVLPEDADEKGILWSSSDTSVITVSDDGLVRAISEGTATIKAYCVNYPEIFAECEVTVSVKSEVESPLIEHISVMARNNILCVDGLADDVNISLYSLDGCLLGYAVTNGSQVKFEVPGKGIYILRIGNQSLKITI